MKYRASPSAKGRENFGSSPGGGERGGRRGGFPSCSWRRGRRSPPWRGRPPCCSVGSGRRRRSLFMAGKGLLRRANRLSGGAPGGAGGACGAGGEARGVLAAAEKGWEETGLLLSEQTARLDTVADTRRKTEARLEATGFRLSALRRVQEQRDWASSGVRAVLQHYLGRGNGDSEHGIFGVIGELIETDAPYERAVEAVLGERIQTPVVR